MNKSFRTSTLLLSLLAALASLPAGAASYTYKQPIAGVKGSYGASCALPWAPGQTLASGGPAIEAYASSTVPAGSTCTPITVTCLDGKLTPAGAVAATCKISSSGIGDGISKEGACASGAAVGCLPSTTFTATKTARETFLGGKSTAAGKWYWETTILSDNGFYGFVGIAGARPGTGGYLSIDSAGVDYFGQDGLIRTAGGTTTGAPVQPFGVGAVIGIALNEDAKTISFYNNCILQKTISLPSPATPVFPGYTGHSTSFTGKAPDKASFNFGNDNFVCAVPKGYGAGLW